MAESDTADVFDSVNELRSRPSHAKEYKVGVYRSTVHSTAPRQNRTGGENQHRARRSKPIRRGEPNAPRADRAAAARRGTGSTPTRCGPGAAGARPRGPARESRATAPDTSVSTDRAASWAYHGPPIVLDSALAPSARAFSWGFGARSPESRFAAARAGAPRLTRRGSATVPLPAAGHVTRGRDEDQL
jgi:hypothetical protein